MKVVSKIWESFSRALNKCRDLTRADQIGLVTLIMLSLCSKSFGEELRVLSSMSPRFTETFVEEFKARYPNIDIVILNKNTNSAIEELIRGNSRDFDIFWASSPEAFSVLEGADQFRKDAKRYWKIYGPWF